VRWAAALGSRPPVVRGLFEEATKQDSLKYYSLRVLSRSPCLLVNSGRYSSLASEAIVPTPCRRQVCPPKCSQGYVRGQG